MSPNKKWIDRNPEVRKVIGEDFSKFNFGQMRKLVILKYQELGNKLPDSNAWKMSKLEHSLNGEEVAFKEIAPLLGLNLEESVVLSFLLLSHDVGRLVEAINKESGVDNKKPHGYLSAVILKDLFSEEIFSGRENSTLWRAMLDAIEHHSDLSTPLRSELGVVSWSLTSVLRDIDKGEGFSKAEKYTSDQKEKARQIEVNWKKERQSDFNWGTERKEIIPARMIDLFERGETLPRSECQSYEAYMLQLLAWIHDIVNPEIRQIIIDEGGPGVVVSYLSEQLKDTNPGQFDRIMSVYKYYL